jgi:hypothetical protein
VPVEQPTGVSARPSFQASRSDTIFRVHLFAVRLCVKLRSHIYPRLVNASEVPR